MTTHRIVAYAQMILHGMRMVFHRDIIQKVPWKIRPKSYDNSNPPTTIAHDRWIPFLASWMGQTVLIPDSLVLYRQHESNAFGLKNPTQSWSIKKQLMQATKAEDYARWSRLASGCMDFLKSVEVEGEYRIAREEGLAFFTRLSGNQNWRSRLYGEMERGSQWIQWGKMVWNGGYTGKEQGGLGWKSMLKDLVRIIQY